MPKAACEHENVTVLWNQEVHTDTDVMANRPGIIITKIQNMHADKYGNTKGQKCQAKGNR
jgi:hypothetical protein